VRAIEKLIEAEDWERARGLIRAALRAELADHWLLTRLSLTYYEQRRYRTALRWSDKALALGPDCPLVL
jgi:tetratricopeptide (TPR) repeat protein